MRGGPYSLITVGWLAWGLAAPLFSSSPYSAIWALRLSPLLVLVPTHPALCFYCFLDPTHDLRYSPSSAPTYALTPPLISSIPMFLVPVLLPPLVVVFVSCSSPSPPTNVVLRICLGNSVKSSLMEAMLA